MGIVSAIGVDTAATLRSLLDSVSGIATIEHLDTAHRHFPSGEVHLSNADLAALLGVPLDAPVTRTSMLGQLALREALGMAALDEECRRKAPFISGTTVGGMDMSERYYRDFADPSTDAHSEYIPTHDCGSCSEMIAAPYGPFAFITTLSTACSSAANAIILAARLIASGQCDVAVAGGAECLTRFHLNGFNALRILDSAPCRPFDAARGGINLGEGAAYLVLESARHARRRGAAALCRISGWGNACDAYHQTATSPEGDGPAAAMLDALRVAGISPADVGYVNAHGTATPNNDLTESMALRRVFGSDGIPPVSSTKAFTGHTTSASGAVEAVICILAMRHGFIPANLNFSVPDAEIQLTPVRSLMTGLSLRHVMCNSFGFGGNDSSMIFSQFCSSHDE